MRGTRVKPFLVASFVLGVLLAAVLVTASGCAGSAQAEADRLEALYGPTVSQVNDLRLQGVIDADTYHNVITPTRVAVRGTLDEAKGLIAAGENDRATILLQSVNQGLLKLGEYLVSPPGALRPPATRPTSRPTSTPLQASTAGAGILLALSILQNWSKIQPVLRAVATGQELTPEQRAIAEQYSADADAEADRLDAEAVDELSKRA